MEMWDVYDVNRQRIGKIIERGADFAEGEYHIVVHVCVFNSEGRMLIQQRQSIKKEWPNMWDVTAGGSAIEGETSWQAAQRELFEEIGLKHDFSDVIQHMTINFQVGFDDFYFIEEDADISKLKLQFEEVQNVKWASKEEVLELIKKQKFIPYYPSLIEFFFDKKIKYGCQTE